MTIQIQTRTEGKRGCGYRKPGGLYLVAPAEGHACCRLPYPLTVCPCCGAGIKFARGWTWVEPEKLFGHVECQDAELFRQCPLSIHNLNKMGRAGLIWIGEAHYKTTDDFTAEASRMGVSRRITAVPRQFRLGETWVLLAHIKGIRSEEEPEGDIPDGGMFPNLKKVAWKPAIFTVFRPTAIEYVVTGEESEEELGRMIDRGITPVRVINPGRQRRFPLAPLLDGGEA